MASSLSELPRDVIYHILSYFTNREAISKVSILSKDLLAAVHTRPDLVWDSDSSYGMVLLGELEYILTTLERYKKDNIPLRTFAIRAIGGCRCLAYALARVKRSLTSLDLSMPCRGKYSVLPSSIFEAESLVELSLAACVLKQPPKDNWNSCFRWPNLRKLLLRDVCFDKEGTFEDIIKGCPLIQTLDIDLNRIVGVDQPRFQVTNLPNLKQLIVRLLCNQTVVLDALPNLESVDGTGSISKIFRSINTTPVCRWVTFRQSESFRNLRSLSLFGDVGIVDNDNSVEFFSSMDWTLHFPKLEKLSIRAYRHLQSINISSRSLKEIMLEDNTDLLEAKFDTPSIAVFKYDNTPYYLSKWDQKKTIIPKLSFVVSNTEEGGWISRIKLKCRDDKLCSFASWLVEFKEFIASLRGSEMFITVHLPNTWSEETDLMTQDDFSFASLFPRDDDRVEIREIFITNDRPQFFLSDALVFFHGINSFCHPQNIRLRNLLMYDPKWFCDLMIGNNSKFWEVTSVEIDFILNKSRHFRKLRVLRPYRKLDTWEFLCDKKSLYKLVTLRFVIDFESS